jgi:hypothetical protein
MATATLLAESLIMIDRDATSPEQIGRDSCQPFAEDEVPDDLVLQPKICDLEKCLPISGARFEWWPVLALCPNQLHDLFLVVVNHFCTKNFPEFDIAVPLELSNLGGGEFVFRMNIRTTECLGHR